MKKIAIIGGGAAGLVAAISAAKAGADVTVFEQNSDVGKKILASGNGRCNISNAHLNTRNYFGENAAFVTPALAAFDFKTFEKFCMQCGLLLQSKEDGRTYPLSDEAKSVQLALRNAARLAGAKLLVECKVEATGKTENGFWVQEGQERHEGYDALLLCTGSEAAPQLGGNADGYRFAESFGHTVVPTYPSLVQLHLGSDFHHKMAGVKQTAMVTLYVNGVKEEQTSGDILFTRYGISGFAVLDISRSAAIALMQHAAVDIGINLLPGFERQKLVVQLEKLASLPGLNISEMLGGLLPLKVIPHLLQSVQTDPQSMAATLGAKALKRIAHAIGDWRFEVTDTHGFKHAEVSGGGVNTAEIDEKTMESKRVNGLYFAGEVLDIVGRRGGYNLHFAWASGYLAALSMKR